MTEIFDDRLSLKNPPRPETPDEVQFEVVFFDVFSGDGEWHIYKLPDEVREYDDYTEFETVALKILKTSSHFENPFKCSHTMDYLHNTHVLTVNLVTGEMFNPFLEAINQRTRGQVRREVPSGIIES